MKNHNANKSRRGDENDKAVVIVYYHANCE